MQVICYPSTLRGEVPAIPSKSDAHRILICAALADATTRVKMDARLSEDVAATVRCLTALGASFAQEDASFLVIPIRECPNAPVLDCGESGSTLRFLLPVAAALGCNARFTGSGRLPERPIGPMVKALREGGVLLDRDSLPLRMEGKLSASSFELPGNISSQFITGFLFALPLIGGGEIRLKQALESAPYVAMTNCTLARFSVNVTATQEGFVVAPGQRYVSLKELSVEGDWSNMAFFLTAGALGGPVSCSGLSQKSLQGDSAVTALLSRFGAQVTREGDCINAQKKDLLAIEIDAREIPDLVPILSVVAAVSEGTTKIGNAARLRLKESDRLQTVAQMLRSLGGKVTEGEDFLSIEGQESLEGGVVDCCGDHRIAMAAAVAATVCREKTILNGAEAVDKSYPRFFEDYQMLGGKCECRP
ncbi:MAG: 3-phosphoshikimate 1-carboxyvinyltransferase [Oscillospiraceae bacterium]|jgi:3-phosphoshikimate 1-carboxyvinyltransferase|nr:3-phosphoshikimate 1-carboxyvinyltransferase [Oscillospiraceae bacterium]